MDFHSRGLGRGDEIPPARLVQGTDPGALDPLRCLLQSISSRLSDQELCDMKFLLREIIPKGKLEPMKSGQQLFSALLEQRKITKDNLELLKELMRVIKRDDLLSEVVQFEEGQPHASDDQPDEHERRLLKAAVDVICEHISTEWKRLMRELGMSEVKLKRIEAAYPRNLYEQLVQALWEWQKWKGKDAKAADLIKALRGCRLNLAADKVEEKISQLNTESR